jgi:phosphatidylglycerophosphate synthase
MPTLAVQSCRAISASKNHFKNRCQKPMFDARLRPWIDPPLNAVAARCVRAGVTADALTYAGCALGLLAAVIIAAGWPSLALLLFLLGRLGDGLDGAVARATQPTDRGAFLDIVGDFLVYAAVPLGFAVADPAGNALAAAALLASFIASGAAFLAFAALAAKRGQTSRAQGEKAIYYLAGLAEGTETILVLAAMMLWPSHFALLAWLFAGLCAVSAAARIAAGLKALK